MTKEKLYVEMISLRGSNFGLSSSEYAIHISTRTGKLGPRIKVFKLSNRKRRAIPYVMISIEAEPVIIKENNLKLPSDVEKEVKQWVSINHDVLLELWNFEKTDAVFIMEFLERLEKINNG